MEKLNYPTASGSVIYPTDLALTLATNTQYHEAILLRLRDPARSVSTVYLPCVRHVDSHFSSNTE